MKQKYLKVKLDCTIIFCKQRQRRRYLKVITGTGKVKAYLQLSIIWNVRVKKKIVTPNADFWPDYYLQLKKMDQQCQVLHLSYLLLMHTVREKLLTCKSLNFKECELLFKSHLLCTASTHIVTCFLKGYSRVVCDSQ